MFSEKHIRSLQRECARRRNLSYIEGEQNTLTIELMRQSNGEKARSWDDRPHRQRLDDFARDWGVFVERVGGAKAMVAVGDDRLGGRVVPDEKERR